MTKRVFCIFSYQCYFIRIECIRADLKCLKSFLKLFLYAISHCKTIQKSIKCVFLLLIIQNYVKKYRKICSRILFKSDDKCCFLKAASIFQRNQSGQLIQKCQLKLAAVAKNCKAANNFRCFLQLINQIVAAPKIEGQSGGQGEI